MLSLSKQEKNDPRKWRHFTLSTNSSFRVVSCRASPPNIALPAYDRSTKPSIPEQMCCCPAASHRKSKTSGVERDGCLTNPSIDQASADDSAQLIMSLPPQDSIESREKILAGHISRRVEMVQANENEDSLITEASGMTPLAERVGRHSDERPGVGVGNFFSSMALASDMMPMYPRV